MGILCLSFCLSLRARILSFGERRDRCSIGEVRASPCSLLIICSSVSKLCPTLCDNMDCSTPGFPVYHQLRSLLKLMPTELVMPSNHLILSSPSPPALPASESFPMSRLFTSGGQSIGISASSSVLPMNIQGWFHLGLTGLILQSQGLSKIFSSTTVPKH